MARLIDNPPIQNDVFDEKTGKISEIWRRFFLRASANISTSAPVDAPFVVRHDTPALTAAQNLGGLASGYVTIATPLSYATLSSTPTIPIADIAGTLAAANEPAHTGDVTNAAGSLALAIGARKVTVAMLPAVATKTVLGRATAGTGDLEVLTALPPMSGAALTTLSGAAVVFATVSKAFADSPYTMSATDVVVLVDSSGGAVSVLLPAPTNGRLAAVRNTAGGGAITIDAGAHTIDGAGTFVLGLPPVCAVAVADGANWHTLAQF